MLRPFVGLLYGVYALLAFVVVILAVFCPFLICTPWLPARRIIGRAAVRAWLACIGVRLRISGLGHLPSAPCVVICNHASYVDGIVLTAALPLRFTFLVQLKIAAWPYVGLIIRRMGVRFVDREKPRAAAAATLGLIRHVRADRGSLAIFPEGTFRPDPGLQPFHSGAFFIAARTGVAVVPAVIRGTRHFFRDGAPWPSWGSIHVEFFAAERAADQSRRAIEDLRSRLFRKIDLELGEKPLAVKDGASGSPFASATDLA